MNTATAARPTPVRLWSAVRDEIRERREVRAEHRTLKRELATYDTRSAVDDLLGTVQDQDSPGAETIRRILLSNMQKRSSVLPGS